MKPDGNPLANALITYAEDGQIFYKRTDRKGKVSVEVSNCIFAVQVSAESYQPQQREIEACSSISSSETHVVEMKSMCNFQIWFQYTSGDGSISDEQYMDTTSYIYSTSSGQNGFGDRISGYDATPLCIHIDETAVKAGTESLVVSVIGKGGNTVNQLEMSHFDSCE